MRAQAALRRASRFAFTSLWLSLAVPAFAQSTAADELRALRTEIEALRAEQRNSNARISELEAELRAQKGAAATPSTAAASAAPTAPAQPSLAASLNPAGSSALATPPSPAPRRLQLSGDFRLRYETNFGDPNARNRDRGVLRARLRANYTLTDWLTLGGQIATGDPDDPNSTDISLSNFNDDLQVSLDQAYARFGHGDFSLYGGKIPQPFVRTDLVWDGDVSPQGVSASYRAPIGGGAAVKGSALYFLVDESVAGPNSEMVGAQIGFESAAGAAWRLELAGAYYDYSLRSVAGADAGDFRSNLLRPDGRYLSDFNLINAIAAISYQGLGARWPVRLVGDYVRNLGAATDDDTGFGIDLFLGRGSKRGDWRFGYGYAEAEVDAVLAAFSHDNTNLATNYVQHMALLDYVPRDNLILNATLYHYRAKDPLVPGPLSHEWVDRLRLNLLMNF
jgi:hypothetical protein